VWGAPSDGRPVSIQAADDRARAALQRWSLVRSD
ncbi:hypothetical protein, partial [Mycobacterium nebraskense]